MTEDGDWADDEEFWTGITGVIYDEHRMERAGTDVAQLTALLGMDAPTRVLDLCCGPGRHSVQLAKLGHDVVGVDITGSYLDIGRQLAERHGVRPEFVQADGRQFVATPSVDVALCLWTSFGYFEDPADNLLMLKNARASLADGGVMMLQTRSRETLARHHPVPRVWDEKDGKLLLAETKPVDGWNRVTGRWIVVDEAGRRDYPWTAWLYAGDQLAAMFHEAGFSSVSLYGGFDGRPYDGDAKFLVVVART